MCLCLLCSSQFMNEVYAACYGVCSLSCNLFFFPSWIYVLFVWLFPVYSLVNKQIWHAAFFLTSERNVSFLFTQWINCWWSQKWRRVWIMSKKFLKWDKRREIVSEFLWQMFWGYLFTFWGMQEFTWIFNICNFRSG